MTKTLDKNTLNLMRYQLQYRKECLKILQDNHDKLVELFKKWNGKRYNKKLATAVADMNKYMSIGLDRFLQENIEFKVYMHDKRSTTDKEPNVNDYHCTSYVIWDTESVFWSINKDSLDASKMISMLDDCIEHLTKSIERFENEINNIDNIINEFNEIQDRISQFVRDKSPLLRDYVKLEFRNY